MTEVVCNIGKYEPSSNTINFKSTFDNDAADRVILPVVFEATENYGVDDPPTILLYIFEIMSLHLFYTPEGIKRTSLAFPGGT